MTYRNRFGSKLAEHVVVATIIAVASTSAIATIARVGAFESIAF